MKTIKITIFAFLLVLIQPDIFISKAKASMSLEAKIAIGVIGLIATGVVLSAINKSDKKPSSSTSPSPTDDPGTDPGTTPETDQKMHHYNGMAWDGKGLAIILMPGVQHQSCTIVRSDGKGTSMREHGSLDEGRQVFALHDTNGKTFDPSCKSADIRCSGGATGNHAYYIENVCEYIGEKEDDDDDSGTTPSADPSMHHYNSKAWHGKGLAIVLNPGVDHRSCKIVRADGKENGMPKHGSQDKGRYLFSLYNTTGKEFDSQCRPAQIMCFGGSGDHTYNIPNVCKNVGM